LHQLSSSRRRFYQKNAENPGQKAGLEDEIPEGQQPEAPEDLGDENVIVICVEQQQDPGLQSPNSATKPYQSRHLEELGGAIDLLP
jgi:hypothetical protein